MKLSIIVPVYNEAEGLINFTEELSKEMRDADFECLIIDDGSSDETFNLIKEVSSKNNRFKGISLSRNFGQQIALFVGLKEASGDFLITMDADLQHPPSIIRKLIKKQQEGFDIVNTRRIYTGQLGVIKKSTSKFYYAIINKLSEVKIENASSDFRLMTRKAANAFIEIPEKDRFNRGLVSWMGFNQAIVEFEAPQRQKGKSKFTLKKMFRLGMDGIISFSAKPLKLIFNIGLFNLIAGVIYLIYIIVQHSSNNTVPGWTSTMIVILILGGIQLISIGIIGQYIARIFNEVKNRPLYFIKDRC